MKLFFDFCRRDSWKPGTGILWLLLALVAGGGCGKSQGTTTTASSPVSTPVATAPVATQGATPAQDRMQPSVPAASPKGGVTQLQLLNRALVGWEMKNHRHPQTFDEFANTANVQIPSPPAGQRYAFNQRGYIVLINSTQ